MKPLAKILIAGTATLMLTLSSAYADGSNNGDILNGQVNLNAQQATLNLSSDQIVGNVSGGASAGGNAVDITAMNNPNVNNSQYVGNATIGSDTTATISNIGGTTDLQSQSVCNSASISMDPTSTYTGSNQECGASNTSATVHASVMNTNNDVSLASTAVGNTFEEDSTASMGGVSNIQLNHSAVNTSTNVTTNNIGGNVSASAQSIGNTATIIHYSAAGN
jgi:hypothetical protein